MDLDKDGVLDVLAGTSINGLVYDYVYEGVDCAADWSPKWMYNAGGDVRSIYVLDVDKDGKNEVLVSSATSSISGNRPEANMLVLRDNGVIEWAEDKVGGLMNSVYAVDMDNDGSPDVWSDRTSTFTCLIVLVI